MIHDRFSTQRRVVMRAMAMAAAAVFILMARLAPVPAAPAAPHDFALGASGIELVRGGCGPGWHPQAWTDRWGNWHRRCVPNRW
jgi:hypothetical protein